MVFFFKERFICFVHAKDFTDKVDWDVLEHILIQIVSGKAKEVVEVVMLQLHLTKATYTLGTYSLFTNGYVKNKLMSQFDTKEKLKEWLRSKNVHCCLRIKVYNEIKF